ncbi:MAG TPA: radical SAM family heme chaperone HemW [Methylomirabilota bacterium]|nr:radical SAM family heme chaperone HemW [Methylomirabilota bacterium]
MPFCATRCHFCSFNTAPFDREALARYLEAAHREIALLGALPWADAITIVSVFLGGGTPSLLHPDDVAALLRALGSRFRVASDVEVTLECNPESVSVETFAGYRAAGITRFSLGVQTLDDAVLARLGRLHSARDAHAAFEAARTAGADNVSVDLMYGLPGVDVAAWVRTMEQVLDWQPDHLSAYGLTLDAGSLWGAAGVPDLPSEGVVVEQYWALARRAQGRGFEHYEISNYARPGFRSRHNQIYWRAAEYLAGGPGACGFVGDVRYGNHKPVPRYAAALASGTLPLDTWERLTPRQRQAERLILGLRTADGVPGAWLDERVADDTRLGRLATDWEQAGLLRRDPGRVLLTESGFLLSDALFVELL